MVNDKFLLVSLEEDKAKKLTQVISSETARKILNILSEKELSETDLSKKLNLPLNTVHYNIQQLETSGLIESKEFKWSEKGKKIKYYKPVNKYIIISPKQESFSSIIKNIIPVTLIGAFISAIIYFFQKTSITNQTPTLMKSVGETALDMVAESIPSTPNYALFFLIGVLTTSFLYLLIYYWRYKR